MNDMDIMLSAIETYGNEAQIVKSIEEMSELMKNLCKYTIADNSVQLNDIFEEIADVEIMITQLKMIFGNSGQVEAWKIRKLMRLKERLDNAKKSAMSV